MQKSDFPLLANHPEIIYLDNAATTQKPAMVIDGVSHFIQTFIEDCILFLKVPSSTIIKAKGWLLSSLTPLQKRLSILQMQLLPSTSSLRVLYILDS